MTDTVDRESLFYFTPAYYYTPAAISVVQRQHLDHRPRRPDGQEDLRGRVDHLPGLRRGRPGARLGRPAVRVPDRRARTCRPSIPTPTRSTTSRSVTACGATRRSAPSRRSRPSSTSGGPIKIVGDPLYYEPLVDRLRQERAEGRAEPERRGRPDRGGHARRRHPLGAVEEVVQRRGLDDVERRPRVAARAVRPRNAERTTRERHGDGDGRRAILAARRRHASSSRRRSSCCSPPGSILLQGALIMLFLPILVFSTKEDIPPGRHRDVRAHGRLCARGGRPPLRRAPLDLVGRAGSHRGVQRLPAGRRGPDRPARGVRRRPPRARWRSCSSCSGKPAAGNTEALALASAKIPFRLKVTATWIAIFFILGIFLALSELDTGFIRENFWYIAKGLEYTILLAACAIVLATILALLGALGRLSHNPVAYGVSGFYTSFFRGTPLIVQLFLIYLALPADRVQPRAAVPRERPDAQRPSSAGVIGLGLNYGAYMTEIFRAGIQSVGHGQAEAADALGMTYAPADAACRAAAGGPRDHPADRQRVHRDDEGHGARQLPRSGSGAPRSCSCGRSSRSAAATATASSRSRRGGAVLDADVGLHVLPEPARAADLEGLRADGGRRRRDAQSARSSSPSAAAADRAVAPAMVEHRGPRRGGRAVSDEPVVRVENLHKYFGALEVLKGIDMEVNRGEVVVIFGRSGSGKSTLLRCINFLEDPTYGSIEVAGIRLEGGHRTTPQARADPAAADPRGDGVPAVQPVPEHDCAAERHGGAGDGQGPEAGHDPPHGAWSCWRRSGWRTRPINTRSGSPVASSSGSRSPGRSRWSPT